MISVAGVVIGSMALIVVLSAFNGIDSFIQFMLSNFDPDLKIEVAEGKSFQLTDADFESVKKLDGVIGFVEVVEENALLRYDDRQRYATVKGVDETYVSTSGMDSTIIDGEFMLQNEAHQFTVLGQGVAYDMSVGLSFVDPVHFFVPKKEQKTRINLDNAYNHAYLFPSGVFSVQQEIDTKYAIVPISFARELFELDGRVTSVELKLDQSLDIDEIKQQVKQILGAKFIIKDRFEQHELLYRVMRSEKWSSFLILSFILVIASFNLLGSLTMIIIDKKDDIKILESMGADRKLIRRIFLLEGWLISLSGVLSGLLLGIFLVWAQIRFELVKLPGDGAFALSAYPVELKSLDVLATFLIVLAIGFFAAWYPVRSLSQENN
ncbi:ABC transporter permease [Sunxiuqinia sp. A32]|uniref:ABC transporter permease n=1 Tax=Sunxiuqinia sp. A32 TaxID=3461496 RepID=UPI004045FDFB